MNGLSRKIEDQRLEPYKSILDSMNQSQKLAVVAYLIDSIRLAEDNTTGQTTHLERLRQRISELGQLSAGWDGQEAAAPSQEALRQVSKVVELLPEDILGYCAIFPSNDSSIYIQGKFPAARLTASLNGEGMSYVLKDNHHIIESGNTTIEDDVIRHIASIIKEQSMV